MNNLPAKQTPGLLRLCSGIQAQCRTWDVNAAYSLYSSLISSSSSTITVNGLIRQLSIKGGKMTNSSSQLLSAYHMPDSGLDAFRYIICTSQQLFKASLSFADGKTKILRGEMIYQRPQLVNKLARAGTQAQAHHTPKSVLFPSQHTATGQAWNTRWATSPSSSHQEHKPAPGQPAEGKQQQANLPSNGSWDTLMDGNPMSSWAGKRITWQTSWLGAQPKERRWWWHWRSSALVVSGAIRADWPECHRFVQMHRKHEWISI